MGQSEKTVKFVRPTTVRDLLNNLKKPKKAVVTGGMPYANGPIHLGHLAGAHIPPDIYARWLRMLIGKENVLFVSGTDDHGSTSELSAKKAGAPTRDFIDSIHAKQSSTLSKYSVSYDAYVGTSRPDTFPHHKDLSQDFIRKLYKNGMLEKKLGKQWFDTKLDIFLQDRYVNGKCPNPNCENTKAYSDECDTCGHKYGPEELINPISTLSDSTPILKETVHWWLDMWKVSDIMREWIATKKNKWRTPVFNEVYGTVLPALQFSNVHEKVYKEIKGDLPKHKSRYAPGKKVVLQFESKDDLSLGEKKLHEKEISTEKLSSWAHRCFTRDVSWGIPLPEDLDPEMKGKTLYVWPDSLIAPISFSQTALKMRNEDPKRYLEFWTDPEAKIYQFLGQDNVYFYVLMQSAMWLGTQDNPLRHPEKGDLQMTEVFGCFLLMIDGEKMSKSKGNYYTGDQLIDEMNYSGDQVRYFLALLGLPEKSSNFDFTTFHNRNKFLAGPMNAAFEKPIAAVHSKFGGKIPEGELLEKAQKETFQIAQKYFKLMERAEYSTLLFAVENYARLINSFFAQYKPHDDRYNEKERRDALYSSFYVLKNIMIMLHPFAPETMDKLRVSLNLPENVFNVEELDNPIKAGLEIGEKQQFFPAVPE